jgi:hypothetical protein
MNRRTAIVASVALLATAGRATAQDTSGLADAGPVAKSCPPLLADFVERGQTQDGTWIPMSDAFVWFDFTQGRITQVARPLEDGTVKSFTLTEDHSDDSWMLAFVD